MHPGSHTSIRRALSVLLVPCLFMASCSTWTTRPDVYAAMSRAEAVERCRVRLASGEQVVLRAPVLVGDSLVGRIEGQDGAARTIAVGEIRQFETYAVNVGATTVGLLVAGAAGVFIGLLIWAANYSGI